MANLSAVPHIWCDEDEHRKYEYFADFNEWLEGEEGADVRRSLGLESWARPSKVLFAGDRKAYDVFFAQYRLERRNEWLSRSFLDEVVGDAHWSDRNERRFDHLVGQVVSGAIVPFIGAGISRPGGFPTWEAHLRHQWRTAALQMDDLEILISAGSYEGIIEKIEQTRGRDIFVQELRDSFDREGTVPDSLYIMTEMFTDTLITTNYDRLIEQAFDTGSQRKLEVLTPRNLLNLPEATRTTLVKLHGDIRKPAGCILSKGQYDLAYGPDEIDLMRPIAQVLDYYYRNSSLLFLGCSLNRDRTIRVFEAIKSKAFEEGADLPQHFSIEQCPTDMAGLSERNAYLLRLGITPIWFETGKFECVEGILRLLRNEVRYRWS